jgi:hypothetical protein
MTSVSVALCTRNGSQYLGAQLRSICAQSRVPQEIVLSDDASTDGSVDLAERTVTTYPWPQAGHRPVLRVLENRTPLGVVDNFEQAVRACSGDLIALCDQDDVWLPDRLAMLQAEMDRRPRLLLLHSDARLVDAEGQPLGRTQFAALGVRRWELEAIHAGRALEVLLRTGRVTGATTLFRRDLLLAALPFPAEWWHDEWLALIAASVGTVDVIEQALIDYRQHGKNAIGAPEAVSPLARFRHTVAPGGGLRRCRQFARAERLLDRLSLLGDQVPEGRLDTVREMVAHHAIRGGLPPARMSRLIPILRELTKGRYHRFGFGLRTAARDFVESA